MSCLKLIFRGEGLSALQKLRSNIFLIVTIVAASGPYISRAEEDSIGSQLEMEQAQWMREEKALIERIAEQVAAIRQSGVKADASAGQMRFSKDPKEGIKSHSLPEVIKAGHATQEKKNDAPLEPEMVLQTVATSPPAKRLHAGRGNHDETPKYASVDTSRMDSLEKDLALLREEHAKMHERLKALEAAVQEGLAAHSKWQEPRARFAPSLELRGVDKKCEGGRACSEDDLLRTAMVAVPRVILRSGPMHSATRITTLQKGDRLTVELVRGEWARVVTETGLRAWMPSEAIVFD